VIVLDTNVISPLMRNVSDERAVSWLDNQPWESLWLTAISLFELRYGIEICPPGRRRQELEHGLARILDAGFQNRILDFNSDAASAAALIAARRRKSGRTSEIRDTLIAGIVVAHGADFATRNVRHFQDLDVRVIDPWAS
jgi:predicted nucleic acid-binding protein